MAKSKSGFVLQQGTEKSLLQDISQQLTCSICLDHYKIPKTLPCLHTFCQECLQETIDSTATIYRGTAKFPCPKCRSNVQFYCPSFAAKKTAAENQFMTNFDIQSHLEAIKSKMVNGCSKHTGEMLMFYCTNCKQAICQVCLLNDHLPSKRHILSSIKEAAQRLKNMHKPSYSNIQKRCAGNNKILSQNPTQLLKFNEIKTSAGKLIKILDSTRQQVSQFMQEIEDDHKNQSTEMAANVSKYQDDSDKLKGLLEGEDLQLVLNQKCASDLITKLIQTPPIRVPTQCQSAGVADIVLTLSDQLRQLALNQGWKYNNKESKETLMMEQPQLHDDVDNKDDSDDDEIVDAVSLPVQSQRMQSSNCQDSDLTDDNIYDVYDQIKRKGKEKKEKRRGRGKGEKRGKRANKR
ncbi:E3 ubiquitin-protein ligase TRIM13-like [Amphiura filiformis]|uniref:E3 ubiquitin-protein ligase TRIM13-like n=1 Tax=Amphiura filiformis TaxID=82378 RepID=UPI003B21CB0E